MIANSTLKNKIFHNTAAKLHIFSHIAKFNSLREITEVLQRYYRFLITEGVQIFNYRGITDFKLQRYYRGVQMSTSPNGDYQSANPTMTGAQRPPWWGGTSPPAWQNPVRGDKGLGRGVNPCDLGTQTHVSPVRGGRYHAAAHADTLSLRGCVKMQKSKFLPQLVLKFLYEAPASGVNRTKLRPSAMLLHGP